MSFKAKMEMASTNAHAKENQRLRQELARVTQELETHKLETEALTTEHKYATRKLSFHEKREKARADGLKKAQASRKKSAGTSSARRSPKK